MTSKFNNNGKGLEDKLSLSGSDENESQMFKELFQPTNKQGISGVSVSVTSKEGKTLNQNRSKKDLKNKFQSSSATYYNQDLEQEPAIVQNIKTHVATQDENDKENKKTKVYKLSGNIETLKKKSAGTVQYSDLIEDEEEVDDIINQHLMEEEQSKSRKNGKKKAKKGNAAKKKKEDGEIGEEIEEDLFAYKKRDAGSGGGKKTNADLQVDKDKDSEEEASDDTDDDDIYAETGD